MARFEGKGKGKGNRRRARARRRSGRPPQAAELKGKRGDLGFAGDFGGRGVRREVRAETAAPGDLDCRSRADLCSRHTTAFDSGPRRFGGVCARVHAAAANVA